MYYSYPPSGSEVFRNRNFLLAAEIRDPGRDWGRVEDLKGDWMDSSSEKIGLDSSKDESSPGGDAEVKGPCADS